MRETQTDRAPEKYGHVGRETGPVQRKSGVGPGFLSSVTRFRSPDEAKRNPGTTSPASRPPGLRFAPSGLRNKMKEAERRQTQGHNRRILRCGARPFGARTLDGVPPRLSPKGIIPSQRLSFRPGFLGRGLHGRYPPSPVPVQGCTSHPGHNAGRHDAQAAREQAANPPAGTALAPMTRCASAPRPSMSEDDGVTIMGTNVKVSSPKQICRNMTSHHNVPLPPKAGIGWRFSRQ